MSLALLVSPKRALELLRAGYTYLDVRSEVEFDQGHPPGAFNIPWALVQGDQLVRNEAFSQVVTRCFPTTCSLLVGCHSGRRSRLASEVLQALGYCSVADLEHGFCGARDAFGRLVGGWSRAGFPMEHQASPQQQYGALLARIAE